MDDKTVMRKMNQAIKLLNELSDEASRRYGRTGSLFMDESGLLHLMSDDSADSSQRQQYIQLSSSRSCSMSTGVW